MAQAGCLLIGIGTMPGFGLLFSTGRSPFGSLPAMSGRRQLREKTAPPCLAVLPSAWQVTEEMAKSLFHLGLE